MSVIAKVDVRGVEDRHTMKVLEMGCVCESALMSECGGAKEDENILFTKASPWGEARARFYSAEGKPLDAIQGDNFYVVFTRQPQPDAWAWEQMHVASITDFGGTTRQIHLASDWGGVDRTKPREPGRMSDFSFKMSIDNPGAYEQFTAGERGWYVGLYKASAVTMAQALALAHSFKAPADAEA